MKTNNPSSKHRNAQSFRWLTAAITIAASHGTTIASLPVFSGPTYNPTTSTGYDDAAISASPASSINNKGVAVGESSFRKAGADGGDRPVFWTPSTWSSLPTGPDPASGIVNGHTAAVNAVGTFIYDYERFGDSGGTKRSAGRLLNGAAGRLDALSVSPAGDEYARPLGLNWYNTAVGTSSKYDNSGVFRGNRAVRWAPNSFTPTELPSLTAQANSAYVESVASDLNDSNVTVGYSGIYSGNTFLGNRAVKWSSTGVITQLGTLGTDAGGTTNVKAIGVNNSGVIVGNANKYNASNTLVGQRGVRFIVGGTLAIELSPLSTGSNGFSVSEVKSVSDAGLIVGLSNAYSGANFLGTRAVYWSATGTTPTELPNLGLNAGTTAASANSANADGVIAGVSNRYVGNVSIGAAAVIWTTAGTDAVIDLNTLLPAGTPWKLNEATGISDTGFVSGIGTYNPGNASTYTRHFSMLVPQAGSYGRGDANFDTAINFADLVVLAQNYNTANVAKKINVGDFNLDGFTNFADLVKLAQHYNTGVAEAAALGSESLTTDWALAQSMVPEPVSILAIVTLMPVVRRRR